MKTKVCQWARSGCQRDGQGGLWLEREKELRAEANKGKLTGWIRGGLGFISRRSQVGKQNRERDWSRDRRKLECKE